MVMNVVAVDGVGIEGEGGPPFFSVEVVAVRQGRANLSKREVVVVAVGREKLV